MEQLLTNQVSQASAPPEFSCPDTPLREPDDSHPKQIQKQLDKLSSQSNNVVLPAPSAPAIQEPTRQQIQAFRWQVLAYKHLVRNLPVVEEHTQQWLCNHTTWQSYKQRLIKQATTRYVNKTEKLQELKGIIINNNSKINTENFQEQFKIGLDRRRTDIEHQLEKEDQISSETKIALQIEGKFLAIRQFYKGVMTKLAEGMRKEQRSLQLFGMQLLDRSYFRREKLRAGEGGRSEKVENQMKSETQRRKKLKHIEFMQHLRSHLDEFTEWHRKKLKDRKKVITQAKAQIDAKREQKEKAEQKCKIMRLKQLKAHNIEAYIDQVEMQKRNKIKQLLSQTNAFLKQLGAKVLTQKGGDDKKKNIQNISTLVDDKSDDCSKESLKSIFQTSNTVYYNLTHTVTEEIKKQPSILVGGQLKGYQIHGLQWLVSLYNNNLNGILADEMGLGKTIQTISLLCYLIEYKKNTGPFLIVAPLTTISNWVSQFQKWSPQVRKIVYKGNPTRRAEAQKLMRTTRWNVCITSYDFILKDRLKLNKFDWKYIVIDEGHKMKNAKGKFANILAQQYSSEHRLLLTGTPLQNNLGELWALLNFLLPKVFNSCQDFQKWFSMAIYKSTGDESVQLDEQQQLLIINRLHQVLRPFLLRRIKKEVYSQLPDKKQHVIKVQMSAWQKLIYDNISSKTALQFASNSGKISKTTLTNLMMQLRKCCNHPYLFLKNYDDLGSPEWIVRASGKFELLDRILPKLKYFGHRVLIFTQMTHLMDIMQLYFINAGIRHLRLDGSTKTQDRQERMRLFNMANSEYDIFLLSTRAGGLGLNLQTADTVIIFDSDWNPQMDLQAQDRVHRIGQEKQVIVLRLITNNSIEEHILERTAFKMNLTQLFIQGGLYNLNSSQAQRQRKIQDILLKRRANNQQNDDQQVLDDDMINQYLKRNEEQYEQFTKMDRQRNECENIIEVGEGGSIRYNPRLMRADQIPSWFIQAPKIVEINKEYGRGNRTRKQINYSDEAVDEQFLNVLGQDQVADDNQDDSAIQVPNKGRQRDKNRQKKRKDQQQVIEVEDMYMTPEQQERYAINTKVQEQLYEDD